MVNVETIYILNIEILCLNTYMHMINIALLLLEIHRNMTDEDTRMQDQKQGEDAIMKGNNEVWINDIQ